MKQKQSKEVGMEGERFAGRSNASARVAETVFHEYDLDDSVAKRAFSAGLLLRVRELVLRELDATLGMLGASHARHQVLAIICRSPEGLQIGEVAARASVHPTTMTSTIDRLRRDGLIARRTVRTDRRAIRVVATPKGQELYEQARDALTAMEFGLGGVDLAVIDNLTKSLDEVAVALERKGLSED